MFVARSDRNGRPANATAIRWGSSNGADVAIGPVRFGPEKISSPILRCIYQYWLEKAGAEGAPARGDIEPLDLPRYLPHIFLVEVSEEGRFRYRVVGTRIVDWSGFDPTGKHLKDVAKLYDVERIRSDFQSVAGARAPRYDLHQAPWAGRDYMQYHRLLAPLAEKDGRVTHLLGGIDLDISPANMRRT